MPGRTVTGPGADPMDQTWACEGRLAARAGSLGAPTSIARLAVLSQARGSARSSVGENRCGGGGAAHSTRPRPVVLPRPPETKEGDDMAALTLDDVDVLEPHPLERDPPVGVGQRPCPFCGHSRDVDDGYSAKACNRAGAGSDRWVLLYADRAAQTQLSA